MINKRENYFKLIDAIKMTKKDDIYKPREYKFSIKDLDEKDIKKERIK